MRIKQEYFLKRHIISISIIIISIISFLILNLYLINFFGNQTAQTKKRQKAFSLQMQSKIKAAQEQKEKEKKSHDDPNTINIIVNKKHPLKPLNFVPNDLVSSNGATLSAKAIESFNQMFEAAAAAGQGFLVSSSYRSYDSQIATYDYWVSLSGQTIADTYSARPGYSEHQTGLAVDLSTVSCKLSCFGSTTQYTWLQNHASDYGFIHRYYAGYESITGYSAEEWHYRYVGKEVAKDMVSKGIKTLEQYWDISGGDY